MTTWYSSGYPDPAASPQQPIIPNDRARHRTTPSLIVLPAAVLINELIYIGLVRSNSKMSWNGRLIFTDLGTTGLLAVGLRHDKMTSAEVTAAKAVLVTSQDVNAAAGNISLTQDVAVANRNKRVWELALMTKDPGGEFQIVITALQATTAAGTIFAEIDSYDD